MTTDPLELKTVPFNTESSLVFDTLDIDLVLKVLNQTAFSPFFTFLAIVLYVSQGQNWSNPGVYWTSVWCGIVTIVWLIQISSVKWRNGIKSERVVWEDQIVLITGGASGIGELLANTLAVRNVTVVVLDVKEAQFENGIDNINFYRCDVSQWEAVEGVAKTIIEEVGHPTVIVNNAGVVQGKTITELDASDVQQTFGVNLLAHFWTFKAFLPEIIRKKTGHIVTVGSVMSFVGAARVSDYVASKHALRGLHESVRYELDTIYKTPHIRTTFLAPGFMQTPLFSTSSYASRNPNTPLPSAVFRFLAPPLAPNDVVKRIIAALDLHQSQDINMPFFVNLGIFGTILPSWGRDALQWASGANTFMQGFVKVSGRRADEGAMNGLNNSKKLE